MSVSGSVIVAHVDRRARGGNLVVRPCSPDILPIGSLKVDVLTVQCLLIRLIGFDPRGVTAVSLLGGTMNIRISVMQ